MTEKLKDFRRVGPNIIDANLVRGLHVDDEGDIRVHFTSGEYQVLEMKDLDAALASLDEFLRKPRLTPPKPSALTPK